MKLQRLNTVDDFKALENPVKKSKYMLRYNGTKKVMAKWTVDEPLILRLKDGSKVIVKRWFINTGDELIWSNNNDFFNLRMYSGIDQPSSFVSDAYCLVFDN